MHQRSLQEDTEICPTAWLEEIGPREDRQQLLVSYTPPCSLFHMKLPSVRHLVVVA